MKIFENVANLKASKLTAGQLTSTKGFYAAGDQGGATYLIKTSADYGGTPDEYGDHTLAGGTIAVLQTEGSVNVKQYGATGDGTTDDTAALQAALDVTGEIYLDAGTYMVQNQATDSSRSSVLAVSSNTTLIGKGVDSVIKLMPHTLTKHWPLDLNAVENVVIDNLKIDGDYVNQTGVADEFSHNIEIRNQCKNITVKNCVLIGARGDGIYVGSEFDYENPPQDVTIKDCELYDNQRQQIAVVSGSSVVIDSNRMSGAFDLETDPTTGVVHDLKFINNSGRHKTGAAISVQPDAFESDLLISIYNGEATGNSERVDGIVVSGNICRFMLIINVKHIVVTDNIIHANSVDVLDPSYVGSLVRAWGIRSMVFSNNNLNDQAFNHGSFGGTITRVCDIQGVENLVMNNNLCDSNYRFAPIGGSKNGVTPVNTVYQGNSLIGTGGSHSEFSQNKLQNRELFKLTCEITVSGSPVLTMTPLSNRSSFASVVHNGTQKIRISNVNGLNQFYINPLPYGLLAANAHTATFFTQLVSLDSVEYSVASYVEFVVKFQNNPGDAASIWTNTNTDHDFTIFLEIIY